MKRLVSLLLVFAAAVSFSVTAFAGRRGWDYAENWSGNVIEVTDSRDVTYLVMKESGTAYYDFDILPDWRYFYLIVHAGNYQGRGKCSFTLDCLDEDGNTVAALGSVEIPDDGSFYRTEFGYIPNGITAKIPEGTAVMRLSIIFEGGKNSPYFNVSAEFSDQAANVAPETAWSVPEKMSEVSVETTPLSLILSVGFVCGVALVMMIIARVRKKYKRGK